MMRLMARFNVGASTQNTTPTRLPQPKTDVAVLEQRKRIASFAAAEGADRSTWAW